MRCGSWLSSLRLHRKHHRVIKDMQGETGRTIVGINHGVKRAKENTGLCRRQAASFRIIDSINSIIAKTESSKARSTSAATKSQPLQRSNPHR